MGVLQWLGIGKDIKDAADGVLGGVTKIIDSAKGQLPPEQQVQMAQLEGDLQTKMETLKQAADASFEQFMLQYEGSAGQVSKWILTLRAVIRPVTTILFVLQLSVAACVDFFNIIVNHVPPTTMMLNQFPNGYWAIQGIIIGFWFGGKAGERIAEAFKKKEG